MADDSSSNNNAEVFVYTEGIEVPQDVVRVRVHPSVTVIPEFAFKGRKKLEEVELCDGLLEIGQRAFEDCSSLKSSINIPSTVKVIGSDAFACNPIQSIHLPDSIESIGRAAVGDCNFPILRIPPLIKIIPMSLVGSCKCLVSIELPESVTQIHQYSLSCKSLRNVAIPHQADLSNNGHDSPFCICDDLKQLYNTDQQLIHALKHRFDNLPIHKMIYYKSYNNMTVDQLNSALNGSNEQQDCLGMTPLHILACSTDHNIELYRVLIEKYPQTLITKDRWGALPLLYALWGRAPDEILKYLVESYKSLSPNHELNWKEMIVTLGRAGVPKNVFQALFNLCIDFIPNQVGEWIEEFASYDCIPLDTFKDLVQCGYAERVIAIGLKQFRDEMMEEMKKPVPMMYPSSKTKMTWFNTLRSKLVNYEEEYKRLKIATTTLELALWKKEIDESNSKKKRKRIEESDSDFRDLCRVSCGADIIIEHVLPFLVPVPRGCIKSISAIGVKHHLGV